MDDDDRFLVRANDVIEIRLVSSAEEVRAQGECSLPAFKPQFTHQIFGEKETIYGYCGLKVKLWFNRFTLQAFVGMEFSEKVNADDNDGVEADEVVELLKKWFSPDEGSVTESLDEFAAGFEAGLTDVELGEQMSETTIRDVTYEIRHCHFNEALVGYYNRFVTFAYFFIDGADLVDSSDPSWNIFLVLSRHISGGRAKLGFVGYLTAYPLPFYPFNAGDVRLKIGQFMILPPFQKQGLGARLLRACYDYAIRNDVYEITVEDPSDAFTFVRDLVDLRLCRDNGFFTEGPPSAFTKELVDQVRQKQLITKKQVRRCYEIALMLATPASDTEAFAKFRLAIKQRIHKEDFAKQSATALAQLPKGDFFYHKSQHIEGPPKDPAEERLAAEEKKKLLADAFEATVQHYRAVALRL